MGCEAQQAAASHCASLSLERAAGALTRALARSAELQREARHYAADPAPVTRGAAPLAPPWLDDAWHAQAGGPGGAGAEDERVALEAAWGRWLWLVAELQPHGAPPECKRGTARPSAG